MDYEQKYKEALNLAKSYYENHDGSANQFLDAIFPELRESEDERIRKEILNIVKQLDENSTIYGKNYNYNKWIAWLEKQGEQNHFNYENANIPQKDFAPNTESKFNVGDFVHCTTINEFEYTYIYKNNHGEVIHTFVNYGTSGVVSIDDTLYESSIFTQRKATKEEINTLLQSIHEAGYTWYAKTKQLIKK